MSFVTGMPIDYLDREKSHFFSIKMHKDFRRRAMANTCRRKALRRPPEKKG